jgi:hypothetical protein
MVPASAMLSLPTKVFRIKAAVALAALYAFCLLAPTLAFAFSSDAAVPFCLTENHVGPHHDAAAMHIGVMHIHGDGGDGGGHHHMEGVRADGSSHDQSAPRDRSGHLNSGPADCCGLFPMAGLSGEPRIAFGPSNPASVLLPPLTDALHGRGPDRINRPPIA